MSVCVHLNNFQTGGCSSPCPKAALNSGGHLRGFTGTCCGTGAVLPAAVRSPGALPNLAWDVDQEPLSSPPCGRELCWWFRSPIPVFSPHFSTSPICLRGEDPSVSTLRRFPHLPRYLPRFHPPQASRR